MNLDRQKYNIIVVLKHDMSFNIWINLFKQRDLKIKAD